MVNKEEKDCLTQSIKDLPFSEDFKLNAEKLNFKTLSEILQNNLVSLLKLQGFTYHTLQELIQLICYQLLFPMLF